MNNCNACGAALSVGASDCASCGALVRPEAPGPGSGEAIDPTIGRVANLFEGNYGLPKTYWVYGALSGLVLGLLLGVAIAVTQSPFVALLCLLLLWVYQAFITIAIWNAAKKYPGSKVWSVLARVGTVIGILQVLRVTAQSFGIGG
jgi:hypothetical protein